MLDYSNYVENKEYLTNTLYGGANGNKIGITIDNIHYLIKLAPYKNDQYIYSSISEHIGCNIFNMLGIKAQETTLCLCHSLVDNDKVISVCCRDFAPSNSSIRFYEFAKLGNTFHTTKFKENDLELDVIYDIINNQDRIEKKIINYFLLGYVYN